jgi:dihydroxyacetone kinase
VSRQKCIDDVDVAVGGDNHIRNHLIFAGATAVPAKLSNDLPVSPKAL